jgi:ubiquinone/menaquinone biosynthesis C-methylase UbiE
MLYVLMEEVESFYDKVAGGYVDHDDRLCDSIIERAIDEYLPKGTLRILDAGAGTGRFSVPLLKRGHSVVLTELSLEMLKKAETKLKKYPAAEFVKSSVTNMAEFKDASFDAVIMINAILDYCGDHERALQEAKRVLKKGGVLIATVNNRFAYCTAHELKEEDYDLFRKNMASGDRYIIWGGQEKGHMSHEFTLQELKDAVQKSGLTLKKILGIFNLLGKYDLDNVTKREEFIKLQIEFAEREEYLNNSQDFFLVAEK